MEKIRKDQFRLVGIKLEGKTSNAGGQSAVDCGALWKRFGDEKIGSKIPGKLGEEIYAVYYDYEGDYTQPFSYFIGCKVDSEVEVPSGMESLEIPAQDYTSVVAQGKMPDCIAEAWQGIWNSAIPRAYHYDFEVYDEGSTDWSKAKVAIFLSTKQVEKGSG